MKMIRCFWRKLTKTKALEQTSGRQELYFFDTVYRLTYIEGISTVERSVSYFIYSNTVKLLLILLCVCELQYFIDNIHSIDAATDSVNTIIIQIGAFYKYMTWRRNLAIFKELASSMESRHFDLSTHGRKLILDMWINRNMDTLKLLIGLGIGTLIAWYVYPLVDEQDYNIPVAMVLPFNYCTPTRYFFTYLLVVILFSYVSFFVMINDLIVQAHIMHLLCQFDVLNDCFRNILIDCSANFGDTLPNMLHMNINFQNIYKTRLGNLVDQHKFVLNSTMTLRDLLSAPMLIHMGISTTLLCSIGYQALMSLRVNITKSIMGLLYLGYNMFVLYTICRWCEEVKTQSESTRDAIYSSGWESGMATLPGVRSRILLILLRGSKPLLMNAGGMYELSVAAFCTMVKTSYSALTVLLQLQRNN